MSPRAPRGPARTPPTIDIGCTIVASIGEERDAGRDGAREIAGMYLANKVQNIKGSADTLLDLAGIDPEEIQPIAEAMERGGRLEAKKHVTDEILDRCKPIAGTPSDCIEAIEEYRDAGCTHVMLEVWGARAPRADPVVRRAGAAAFPGRMRSGPYTQRRMRSGLYMRVRAVAACAPQAVRFVGAASHAARVGRRRG